MRKFITNPYFKKGLPGDNGIDPVSTDVEACLLYTSDAADE